MDLQRALHAAEMVDQMEEMSDMVEESMPGPIIAGVNDHSEPIGSSHDKGLAITKSGILNLDNNLISNSNN